MPEQPLEYEWVYSQGGMKAVHPQSDSLSSANQDEFGVRGEVRPLKEMPTEKKLMAIDSMPGISVGAVLFEVRPTKVQ